MCVRRTGNHTQQDIMGSLAPPRSRAARQHRNIRKKTWGVEQKYSCLWETKIGWGNKENFIQRWENSVFNNRICY